MSLTEESTDGRTGMDGAEKYKEGDLEKPMHGYDGKGPGSTSLLNKKTIEYGKEEEKEVAAEKKRVVDKYPFIEEGDQRQFPTEVE